LAPDAGNADGRVERSAMKSFRKGIVVLALASALVFAGAVQAGGPWSLFGDAQPVKAGNSWAVSLNSIYEPPSTFTYSGVDFTPNNDTAFSDIYHLSTDYFVVEGCFGGGSPRFQINIADEDGNFAGNVFVYLGTPPSFNDCPEGWENSGNLIDATDLRFDTSQVGGTFYDDYAGALELVGNAQVLGIQLVVDAGWSQEGGVQTILVDNVRVNNFKLSAKGFSKK
jgi:hypothetical protein